ncbi:MAG: amidase [Loktanella sp.]|nr:amidase [Loktanella sp.]
MKDAIPSGGLPLGPPADPFGAFDLKSCVRRLAPPLDKGDTIGAPDGIADLLSRYAKGQTSPAAEFARFRAAVNAPAEAEAVLSVLDCTAAAEDSTARWQAGKARPLEGILFGVKAIIDVAGAEITCGSLLTGSRVAAKDAHAVSRLRAAGAIPVAILATTEFAAGSPFNPRHGVVTNPYDANRWTGGSSTGSGAAVARRMLPFALGTDTGGSIRVPSCWCGITGLKPTRALLSTDGVAPLSWTLDHLGPMGLCAADLAKLMAILGEVQPRPLHQLRIGVPDGWFTDSVDAAVLQAWRAALQVMETLGATCVPIDTATTFGEMAANHEAGWTILTAELAASQRHNKDRRDEQDAGLKARIARGEQITAADYLLAMGRRSALIERLLARWDVDVLVTPGLGGEAGHLDGLRIDIDGTPHGFDIISRNTMIWDLVGFPALMLPSGVGPSGLPLGIQIVARPYDDALCLALGAAFQGVTGHHLMQP